LLDRLGREVRIVFCRFDGGVMRAVCPSMFFQFRTLAAHTTAHDGNPTCGDTAENYHRRPNLRHF
jgi:hypothetical protein